MRMATKANIGKTVVKRGLTPGPAPVSASGAKAKIMGSKQGTKTVLRQARQKKIG